MADAGGLAMNAEFFALAFFAALNPKLLAIDLLLMENRRPRAMFLCVLLGGLAVGLTIGLLDVLVFHADAINSQKTVSARCTSWSPANPRPRTRSSASSSSFSSSSC